MQPERDLEAALKAVTHLDEAYTLLWNAGFKSEAFAVQGAVEQILDQIPEERWPD